MTSSNQRSDKLFTKQQHSWVLLLFCALLIMTTTGCTIFGFELKPVAINKRTVKRTSPNSDVSNQLLKQAMQAQSAGNLDQALNTFLQILEKDPKNFNAHMGVGDIYHIKGDFQVAANTFEKARTINPRNFDVNYKLGLMYHLLNRVSDAIQVYLTALSINPDSYEANLNLATAYLQINQPALGLPYAQRAVKLNPTTVVVHANLGAIYSALNRHEEAINAYRTAAEQGELEPHVMLGMADSLIKTGKFTRAINTLNVINQQKQNAVANERLGYIYFKTGDYEKSLAAYEQANNLDDNNVPALNGIGVNLMTQYLQGERNNKKLKNRAIQVWQQSLRINPQQRRIVDLISRYREL